MTPREIIDAADPSERQRVETQLGHPPPELFDKPIRIRFRSVFDWNERVVRAIGKRYGRQVMRHPDTRAFVLAILSAARWKGEDRASIQAEVVHEVRCILPAEIAKAREEEARVERSRPSRLPRPGEGDTDKD